MFRKLLLVILLFHSFGFSQDSRGSIGKSVSNLETGTKRALVVGISNYNSNDLKLNFANNDAALFRDYLIKSEKISEENITTLLDEDAVAMNIARELKRIVKSVASDDTVYIYFAGHGDVVDDFGEKEGFLLAADSNANQEYYAGGVISLDLLNNKVVNNIASKGAKVILILDACRSGFIFQEGTQKNLGTIQAMFENSTKILSCGPNELSYESSDINHGYFTYYLVKGLVGNADGNTDNNLQFRELDDYLYDNVYTTVSNKYKQNQTPVVRTQNDRSTLRTINPEDKTIAFEVLRSEMKSGGQLVGRGITKTNLDENSKAIVEKFNSAIKTKNYHGKPNSALEIYNDANSNQKLSQSLLYKMQSQLLKELSYPAQQLINKYIEGSSILPISREFYKQAKNLEVCLSVMDEDDFLRDNIKASKLLLESYAIIRNKNYSGYKIAKTKLNEALKIQPRAAYVHNALGLVYNYQQVYDSAYYHFKQAKELVNTWSKPVENISDNFLVQYKYDDAKTYLETSVGMQGTTENSLLKLGIINENQGKYQVAESYYLQILNQNQNNTTALTRLSDLYKKKGQLLESKKWYDKALEKDSLNTIINYGLVNYINENRIDQKTAENLLLKAIDYKPNQSSVYVQYADYLKDNNTKRNRLLLADSLYAQAIQKNPHDVKAYSGRGWLYVKLRSLKKARDYFKNGVDKNPNNPEALHQFAQFYEVGLKDKKTAESYYKKAIEKDAYYIPAYSSLVELYNNQGKHKDSELLLLDLTKKNPEAPDFYNLLGNTYFSQGNYTKAVEAFKKATNLDKGYSQGLKQLGDSEVNLNNFEAAKGYYKQANDNAPSKNSMNDISESIITMAKNKERFGTPLEAMSLYKLAFELDDSVKSALPYLEHLYLNSQAEEAFSLLEPLTKKETSKKLRTQLLELLVKTAIDNNDVANADKYFSELSQKAIANNNLLASVYFSFRGNQQQSLLLKRKSDPQLLRSNKLKKSYSPNTIEAYILRN